MFLQLVACILVLAAEVFAQDKHLYFCSDDDHVIYVDGQQVGSGQLNYVSIVRIPSTAKVIAVQVTNTAGPGGFRGTLSDNSIFTDSSWKCSFTSQSGWQNIDFDHRSWSTPLAYGTTAACTSLANSPAQWLWLGNDYYNTVGTLYCRKTLAWNFKVCTDDDHVVFVDGQQVASGPFNVPSNVVVPVTAAVIAIKVINTAGPGGFKAASSDNSLVTDGSWKCSSTLQNGWQNIDFDDSSWSTPMTSGTTTACAGFSSAAQWLWLGNDYNAVITVYCRKSINWRLKVCSDDNHVAYIDGQQVASGQLNYVSISKVPSTAKVIALQVTNTAGPGGFKAAFSDNSIVSDSSWKCSSTFTSGWQNVNFDHSSWLTPLTYGTTAACTGLSSASAQWLWLGNDYNSVTTVYCRKTLVFSLKTCSDDDHVVYVDGQQMSSGPFNVPSSIDVRSTAKVIAIKVINTAGPGGFKAAFSDSTVVTDGSWKCSSTLKSGWQNVDFDDSSWSAPLTSGTTTACAGFPSSAKWLWLGNDYNAVITVSCRKNVILTDACSSSPCKNGAACKWAGGADYTCTCADGFSGSNCQTENDPCSSSPCQNDGTCSKTSRTTFTCQCAAGYSGTKCGTENNPCSSAPCQNGGACVKKSATTYTCQCTDGYSGATCGKQNDPCSSRPCQNGGACTKTSGTTFTCECANGYGGKTCAKENDPCTSSPCKNGATCTTKSGTTFTCQCAVGYSGPDCSTAAGLCAKSPCQNGGTCVPNGANDYDCFCTADYDDGEDCSAYQDPCTSSPCSNGGKCNRLSAQDFSCSCIGDYIGNFCELKKGIEPCANKPCQNGGTCTTTSPSTYTCKCPKRYEGQMCEKVTCLNNTSDCSGLRFGKYAYCSDCGRWIACKAKKQKLKSCASRAPNVNFDRKVKTCTADKKTACAGLV